MKRIFAVFIGSIIILAPLSTSAHAATKYSSCAKMQEKYPTGVAKSAGASSAVTALGGMKPKVSAAVYAANKSLDRDKDGAVCEKQPQAVEFKTDFGIVTTQSVAPPTPGQCVNVPISLDVRNMTPVTAFGMTVEMVSEYGSVIGYEEFSGRDSTQPGLVLGPAGVYQVSLPVCIEAHSWTHASGNRKEAVAGFKADESYTLKFATWLYSNPLGEGEYAFLK